MALQVFSSNSVGDAARANLGTLDDMYVAQGVMVARENAFLWDDFTVLAHGSSQRVKIDGTIAGGSVIELGNGSTDGFNVVDIGETGSVLSFLSNATAIYVTGYSATIENRGTIWSEGSGIGLDVAASGGVTTIVNSGTIISLDGDAIGRIGQGDQRLVINNSGLMSSSLYAFEGYGDAVEQIYNSGHMVGMVSLFGGDDLYDGRGGSVTGAVRGGEGNDTLLGGAGAETLVGDEGNDTMRGGGGNDFYSRDAAGDVIFELANQGIDTILSTVSMTLGVNVENLLLASGANGAGNALANTVTGDSSANTISGLAGNDRLIGMAGNDLLTGGFGRDTLTGGIGADRFTFTGIKDSTVAAGGRDVIVDFSRAQGDKIQLSAIDASTKSGGNQAFIFIGAKAFSGKAGELRFQKIGSDCHITADINGDGKADFAIVSDIAVNFIKGDFIL